MKAPFTPNHPEQVAYEQTCSMWLTDGTSDREKYAYRDGHGWMGVAAQSRSNVDLMPVYQDLRKVDASADWYLHPNHRLLLCGSATAPPRAPSRLTLRELVDVIQGEVMFSYPEGRG